MAEKSTDHSLIAEAANPGTSPECLKELVSHPFLRLTIATNPATPENVLDSLSKENEPAIRKLLTRAYQNCVNNNIFRLDFILLTEVGLPADLLELFARSAAREIRFLAAQHFQISRCLLEELIDDGHQYIRAIARVTLAQRFPQVHFLSDKPLKKRDMEKRI